MRTPLIIIKASLIAACIFWMIIFIKHHFQPEFILLIPVSIIPISIACTITIVLTIQPFFLLKKTGTSNKEVFKKWFPYYAIICFSFCLLGSLSIPEIVCFFASAFFTALQSWVWYGLKKDNPTT